MDIDQLKGLNVEITVREKDVLGLLLEGGTNKHIARTLRLSVHTVRDHISSLLCKTGTRNRSELIATCLAERPENVE